MLVKQEKKRYQINNSTSCEAQSQNERHAVGNRLKRLDVSPSLQSFILIMNDNPTPNELLTYAIKKTTIDSK